METVSSRYGNCQFPPWELTVTKLDDATIDGQWGGHLLTLYVLSLTRMTINDPWMTVNKNFMLNFRTFILIESWKGWMLRLPAFCWWASSPQKICSPTINPFGISLWQKEKQWKPVVRGKAILHDCMVFIVFFNFSTLSTKLTKNRFLLIIATVVIGESIGERSLFWKKTQFYLAVSL